MYQYFPNHYTWNMVVTMALMYGGSHADVDDACAPLMDAWEEANAEETVEFARSWSRIASRVTESAQKDIAQARWRTAGLRLRRAALYHFLAERLLLPRSAMAQSEYALAKACFSQANAVDHQFESIAIPYDGLSLPALWVPPVHEGLGTAAVVVIDDFADAKELTCLAPWVKVLCSRGIGCLVVDAPGMGESLRQQGLVEGPQIERALRAGIDALTARRDVNVSAIGIMGIGFGGYYAIRSAVSEPRLSFAVGCGGLHDWAEVLRSQVGRERTLSSRAHAFEHLKWRLGQSSIDGCLEIAREMHLRDLAPRLLCPLLLLHGMGDAEVPWEQAQRTYEECQLCVDRELSLRGVTDGGSDHANVDDPNVVAEHIADWIFSRGLPHGLS